MRCAERTQACRCESKGSHYYCQKEPSSLLKVWRVLLLQSTQLQNLSENALTLVLIPTSMLSEGPIICFGKSSGSPVFTRLTCGPQARAAWILCRAVCNTASTACIAYSCWFGSHRGQENPRACRYSMLLAHAFLILDYTQSMRWKQDVAHCVLDLAVADSSQPVYGPLDVQGCRFRQCRSILSLPARRDVNQELQ